MKERAMYRVTKGPLKGTIGTFAKLVSDKDKIMLSITNIGNNKEYEVNIKDVEMISTLEENYAP